MAHKTIELVAPPAICRAADGRTRAVARRMVAGEMPEQAVDYHALAAARAATLEPGSGRVQTGGSFEDPRLHAAIAAALPASCGVALRQRFEWYGCYGAFFHNDAHYDGVMFGVLTIAGPPRDVYFPRVDARISAGPGAWVVFDPFEPHGVVAAGERTWKRERYLGEPPTLFIGFEIELTPAVAEEFRIDAQSGLARDAVELSSRSAIHAETGAVG